MFSAKKKRQTPRRELGRKTPRGNDDPVTRPGPTGTPTKINFGGTPGGTTPMKRARLGLRSSTTSASSSFLTSSHLPDTLRPCSGSLPAMLRRRIVQRHGLASGSISPAGKWCYVVCDDGLFVWRHSDTSEDPLLLSNGESLLVGRQQSTLQSSHAERVCVLESTTQVDGGATGTISRSPNVIYMTEAGEVVG